MSQTIATAAGRAKLAQARAGIKALPKCKYITLGTGGADTDGALKIPSETAGGLYTEVVKREIIQPPILKAPATAVYSVKLGISEYADVIFNEIGLLDEEDTLIATKTFNPKQKDGDMEMVFEIEDVF